MSAYAPFNVSYGQYTPYLTVAEYNNAPTAIDTNNLLPNTQQANQEAALAEVIGRASSLIDQECMGAWGTLNATVNTENARIWGNRYGQFVVHPKYWPILEVQSFSYGYTINSSASISPPTNCWIEPQTFIIGPSGVVGLGFNSPGVGRGQAFCTWTYVNGWPNTLLAASVAAGSSNVYPAELTGIYPGTELTLFDSPDDEQVTVSTSYVPGTAEVPLVSPLAYSHPAGAVLTNLPKAAKQAAISLTTCLIKVRGSGALIASDIGEITRVAGDNPQGAASDLDIAMRSIRALKQMFVGY